VPTTSCCCCCLCLCCCSSRIANYIHHSYHNSTQRQQCPQIYHLFCFFLSLQLVQGGLSSILAHHAVLQHHCLHPVHKLHWLGAGAGPAGSTVHRILFCIGQMRSSTAGTGRGSCNAAGVSSGHLHVSAADLHATCGSCEEAAYYAYKQDLLSLGAS
jgi:hypothetical protein